MRTPPSAEELQALSEMPLNGSGRNHAPVAPLPVVSIASFDGDPAPERQWIVRELVPARDITDLAGDGGIGKSLIALQLAVAMATATDWLGHMPTPGRVLYLSCEDEITEIRRRTEIIAKRKSIGLADLADIHVIDLTTAAATELAAPDGKQRIALTGLFQSLTATIEVLRPALAIVDTRADVFGGNEIDRGQVRFFIRALRRLCLDQDMATLLLSHPSVAGMASGTGQSGSTAWGNSVRSRLYLERPKADDGTEPDPDLRLLTTKKANYGPADTSITLRWDAGIFRPDLATAGTLDRIARDQHVEARFLELLREFEKQGRHVNPSSGPNYAPKNFARADAAIGHLQFRAAMDRLFAAGKVAVVPNGRPGRGSKKLVEVMT
jgi:RecA-family ATPase